MLRERLLTDQRGIGGIEALYEAARELALFLQQRAAWLVVQKPEKSGPFRDQGRGV
jgi:hypothetical protein